MLITTTVCLLGVSNTVYTLSIKQNVPIEKSNPSKI